MSLFKRNLDFANQKWTFRPQRLRYWGDFVKPAHKIGRILVAGQQEFETKLAPDAQLTNLTGDYNIENELLDSNKADSSYPTAYCFEVLEHLINPGVLLTYISGRLSMSGSLYISFPTGRPQFLWTDGHFHEFGTARAEKMFDLCGLEVVRRIITPPIWMPMRNYFKGIRPLLRLIWPLRCALYELTPKQR